MNNFIKSLNLRPQEVRLMMIIAVVIFVVLNLVWVRPHFSDLGVVRSQINEAQKKIADYQGKIAKNDNPKNGYKVQLAGIEKKQGALLNSSSAIQLQTTIMTQSAAAGVTVGSYSPVQTAAVGQTGTNDFFEVQSININFDSPEKELVDFLVNIGGDSSMIRVRGMSLSPGDGNRYRLKGTLTLNASYRKQTVKEAPLAPKPLPASARKPAMVPGAQKTDKK